MTLGVELMPMTTLLLNVWNAPLEYLVAEWIPFTLFGIISPTIELKVYAFWGS